MWPMRVAARAGGSPTTKPATRARPTVNSATGGSTRSPGSKESDVPAAAFVALKTLVSQSEKGSPATPPASPSMTLSVSNSLTSLARPAPSASRTAISRRRSPTRASSNPARLAQASVRTNPINNPFSATIRRRCSVVKRPARPAGSTLTRRPARRASSTSSRGASVARVTESNARLGRRQGTAAAKRTTT